MTILVIDDDPLIGSLIQALDPSWHVVSALDGLVGLDILRHCLNDGCPPDLIILDITMPGFDGYDTCILIRSLTPVVPIVPFTQRRYDQGLPGYMHELHCTSPVYKGVAPNILLRHLSTALHSPQPVGDQTTSAVFDRLLQKAIESERLARTQRAARVSIALFAPSVVEQLGIVHLLEAVSDPSVLITSIIDIPEAFAPIESTGQILVSATANAQAAFALCQRLGSPLLLIAHTLHEGVSAARIIADRASSIPMGVVLADHTVMRTLSFALHALKSGNVYTEPLFLSENAVRISAYVTEHHLLPALTTRLATLVVLDFFGWSTADICNHFHVMPLTIETYWSRVAERLGLNRDMVRVRVQHELERKATTDRLRAYLGSSR